jgi:signal transduction histidine kinase
MRRIATSEERDSKETEVPAKKRKITVSVRVHLILLVFLIFLPLIAIESFSAFREYQIQREAVLNNQLGTARTVNRTFSAYINDLQSKLKLLGLYIADQQKQSKTPDFIAFFSSIRANTVALRNIYYLEPDGKIIVSERPTFSQAETLVDTELTRATRENKLTITNLRLSYADLTTPIFAMFYPITGLDNKITGILAFTIDATKLGEVMKIPAGVKGRASVGIQDREANIVYTSLEPDLPYRERLGRINQPVLDALSGKELVVENVKSSLDGIDKLGATVPNPETGWIVILREPIEDALSPAFSAFIPRIISFLVIALLSVLAALFYASRLASPLVKLRQVALEFGEGDWSKRAKTNNHVTEVNQLAATFNQMAGRIVQDTRSKDTFLAQIAHDLKTPVTIIKGTAQLMQRRFRRNIVSAGNDKEELLKQLDKVEYQSNRMIELINRLMDSERLQTGQLSFRFDEYSLLELLERSYDAASQLTGKHKIRLELPTTINPEEWVLKLDRARMEQVILNLLENSIKYTPEGGEIIVSAYKNNINDKLEKPGFLITIKDNGIGIKTEELSRIFERYYRGHGISRDMKGLGLGLYISREIVQHHNGVLWATSDGFGMGSSFHIYLPLQSRQKDEVGEPPWETISA